MSLDLFTIIPSATFYLFIVCFGLLSLLGIYIFIKYGKTKSVTLLTSLVFAVFFIFATFSAFLTLQQIIL